MIASHFPCLTAAETAAIAAPLTQQEVAAACRTLPRGTHPGAYGISAAALKTLARTPTGLAFLHHVLTAVLHHTPAKLHTALLTPIPKVSNVESPSQLRPITIASIWYRILARVLVSRTPSRLYSAGQHGFRPHHSPLTAALELQCVADTAQPLHYLKLDIVKAYDRVARRQLWQLLRRIGFAGPLFDLVQTATASANVYLATDNQDRSFRTT